MSTASSTNSGRSAGSNSSILLIAGREIRTRLLAKATVISTLIMLVLIVGGIVAASIFTGNDEPEATTVAVAAETQDLVPVLEQAAAASGLTLDISEAEATAATEQVRSGDLDAFIWGPPSAPVLGVEDIADSAFLAALTAATQQYVLSSAISDLGGDPAAVGQDLATAVPTVESLADPEDAFDPVAFIVAMASSGLLLFALLQCGSLISMGVVEEKVSRVVEILLATVRPGQLMAGKILGIGAVGLIQVTLFAGVAAIAAKASGLVEGIDLNLGGTLGWLLVWFLLGFAVYSLMFGGFAALVSRQEDIGAVTTPMIFGMMVPFYLGIYLVPNSPDGAVTRALSQIPFFAPFMMPVRQAFNAVETWELALSIALCVALVPLLVWLAGRVYSRAVLNTGGRMKLADALRK